MKKLTTFFNSIINSGDSSAIAATVTNPTEVLGKDSKILSETPASKEFLTNNLPNMPLTLEAKVFSRTAEDGQTFALGDLPLNHNKIIEAGRKIASDTEVKNSPAAASTPSPLKSSQQKI